MKANSTSIDRKSRTAVRQTSTATHFTIFASGIFSLIAGTAVTANAAHYQMMFNNVEQGPGSHAEPSLMVNGEQKKPLPKTSVFQPQDLANDNEIHENRIASNTTSPVTESQMTTEELLLDRARPKKYFRFGLLGALGSESRSLQEASKKSVAGEFMIAAFPWESLGVNFFAQTNLTQHLILGAELEAIPVHAQIFDLPNFLEWGFLVGFSTQGRERLRELGINEGVAPSGTVHMGTRLNLNFGSTFAVTGGLRFNVTSRSAYDFFAGDVGLLVHL